MRKKNRARYCAVMIALWSLAASAQAEHDPLEEPGIQRTLQAMAESSTWFHPDLFGEYTGMRRYAHHQYKAALKYFEIGAFYADKVSQLSLGLMYMNGEGAPKDPVTAYAWLDLAAERDYPDFVATRDTLKARLTPEQLARAMLMREKLAEKYGDGVAKHRLVVQMRQGLMQGVPGAEAASRTGFTYGISCGGKEQPLIGCGRSVFDNVLWDPDQYFASRDREYQARVNVGAVQQLGKSVDKPPQQGEAAPGASADPNANPVQH